MRDLPGGQVGRLAPMGLRGPAGELRSKVVDRYFSTHVAVWRDRRWVALVPSVAALATSGVGAAVGLTAPAAAAAQTGHHLVLTVLGGALLTGGALVGQRLRAPRRLPATVRVHAGHVEIDRGGRISAFALAKRRQGWIRAQPPDGYDVCCVLAAGRVCNVRVDQRSEAEALLAAAGIDPGRHALQTALCDAGPWSVPLRVRQRLRVPAIVYAPALFMTVMAMHVLPPRAGLGLLLIGCAVGVAILLSTIARLVDQPRVTVGDEGVLVEGAFHRRFIPIGDLLNADIDARGVVLTLLDDEVVLPIGVGEDAAYLNDPDAQDARRDILMELLRRAVSRRSQPAASIPQVERQGREITAWSKQVRGTLGSDYRAPCFTADALVELVGCAGAPREQRIGAALALAHHPDPAIGQRLRVAIDTCADPLLEAAIEAAASAELDDLRLHKALEIEAAE